MKSNFDNDLTKESLLGKFLDEIYLKKFPGFDIVRIADSEAQHRGIDVIISKAGKDYKIDEKAQLDYLESDLPTFAFEITYLKNGIQKPGWLHDVRKETDFYFTVTAICCNVYNVPESGFKSCKVFSIHRKKLLELLSKKGLDYERISEINQKIRSGNSEDRIEIEELDAKSEGYFFYSKKGKAEQPINIVFKLDFLLQSGVAKRIH